MAASSVLAFWVVALLLIIVPGADWDFVLSSVLRGRTERGVRGVVPPAGTVIAAVGGIVLGYAGITIVVAAGVGTLVAGSSPVLTALTVVGGLYLIAHGVMTLARPADPGTGAGAAEGRALAVLARGMGVSALNPNGLLIFLALLPQFSNPSWTWSLAAQLAFLGLVFVVSCAAFYLCLGSLARMIVQARPAAARAIARVSGAAMVAVGVLLLIDRLAG